LNTIDQLRRNTRNYLTEKSCFKHTIKYCKCSVSPQKILAKS